MRQTAGYDEMYEKRKKDAEAQSRNATKVATLVKRDHQGGSGDYRVRTLLLVGRRQPQIEAALSDTFPIRQRYERHRESKCYAYHKFIFPLKATLLVSPTTLLGNLNHAGHALNAEPSPPLQFPTKQRNAGNQKQTRHDQNSSLSRILYHRKNSS